jgi:lipoprotein-anchoring transpeptidase ErfK/SrfK
MWRLRFVETRLNSLFRDQRIDTYRSLPKSEQAISEYSRVTAPRAPGKSANENRWGSGLPAVSLIVIWVGLAGFDSATAQYLPPRPPPPIYPPTQLSPSQDHGTVVTALPPEYEPEQAPAQELPPEFYRTVVDYPTIEPPGTIIVDTPNTYLYLTIGHGKAIRYGIGVGREGFTWSGTERISRMKEWPDWTPPKEMIARQPYLPRFMAGGDTNPLGARAMYLGNTKYRIHGTNQPSTIGTFVSSGCIRLTNEDVKDLYSRVTVGTSVIVLPAANTAAAQLDPKRKQ